MITSPTDQYRATTLAFEDMIVQVGEAIAAAQGEMDRAYLDGRREALRELSEGRVARLAKLGDVTGGHPAEHQPKELRVSGCESQVADACSLQSFFSVDAALLSGEDLRAELTKSVGRQGGEQRFLVFEVPIRCAWCDAELAAELAKGEACWPLFLEERGGGGE
jgi:hypothetical protein